ncbi:unnamed protein product [Cuscuta campestris]|uniref:Reverse transcriptase domain-containing protein n=1 Tax=Cuscuta campestris TaxID=132261 RepID=A0A484NAA3_9ASTE|nr:unnamed protein product [Cuscuta campestris]
MRSGNTLSIEQQLELIKDFNPEQVKNALFSIPNSKSPGPDGFNSGFFKKKWNTVGVITTRVVLDFFKDGATLKQINATCLTLIPKVENPSKPTDYRPISCFNTVYKVISKLLCFRLKAVLPHIVDLNQAAFIKGRELLHNILLCKEIAKGYKRKGISPRCMMKVDIQNAYNSVSWKAIRGILHSLNFPGKFIYWIMFCISTPSYTIHINDELHGYFRGGKGLRQGDPISPLLFVLIMEYLTRSLRVAALKYKFSYHPMCANLKIINLTFADDLIVVCKADNESIKCIMEVLERFYATTGLKINRNKS